MANSMAVGAVAVINTIAKPFKYVGKKAEKAFVALREKIQGQPNHAVVEQDAVPPVVQAPEEKKGNYTLLDLEKPLHTQNMSDEKFKALNKGRFNHSLLRKRFEKVLEGQQKELSYVWEETEQQLVAADKTAPQINAHIKKQKKDGIPGAFGQKYSVIDTLARSLLENPEAVSLMKKCGITLEEAVAIRLYTTGAYAGMNPQLRQDLLTTSR